MKKYLIDYLPKNQSDELTIRVWAETMDKAVNTFNGGTITHVTEIEFEH